MKTERRHELQKNDLADFVGHEIDQYKPYLKTGLGVIVALIAVGFTIAYLSQQQSSKNAAAWTGLFDLLASPSTEDLQKFAEDNSGTQAAAWADLAAGDMKLREGANGMFIDRSAAEVNLDEAKKFYKSALDKAGKESMIRYRAQLGLAQTYEALNEPEDAEKLYEELAKLGETSPFGSVAADRLATVKRLNEEKWYTWFAKHTPAPPVDPRTGFPGGLDNLPGRDNLKTPERDLTLPGILEDELKELEKKSKSGGDFNVPLDGPGTTEPAPNELKTTEPKVEEPKVEEPKVEEPKVEEPKVEEPKVEEPKTDEPKVDEPKSTDDQPKDEPKPDEAKPDEAKPE